MMFDSCDHQDSEPLPAIRTANRQDHLRWDQFNGERHEIMWSLFDSQPTISVLQCLTGNAGSCHWSSETK